MVYMKLQSARLQPHGAALTHMIPVTDLNLVTTSAQTE